MADTLPELANIESTRNAPLLPGESATINYTLTEATGVPEWIGFAEDYEPPEYVVEDEYVEECNYVDEPLMIESISSYSSVAATGFSAITPMLNITDPICTCCQKYRYTASSTNATITGVGRTMQTAHIPETIKIVGGGTRTVTRIGPSAFLQTISTLTSVTIPDTVTTIDLMAFAGCTRLTTVSIGRNTNLGSKMFAFSGCTSLTTVTFRNLNSAGNIRGLDRTTFEGSATNFTARVPFVVAGTFRSAVSPFPFTGRQVGVCVCRSTTRTIFEKRSCTCKFRLGDVDGNGTITSANSANTTGDAYEILRYIAGSNPLLVSDIRRLTASLITPASRTRGIPDVFDANEVNKYVAGMAGILKSIYG